MDNRAKKSNNEAVFFELFMNSQKNLYAYILASVHNYADANDLLQETATVLWQKFDQFDLETNFQAWAIAIARNMIKNYFNKRKRSRLQFDDDLVQTIEKATVTGLKSYDARMEALKKCYEKLSDSNRLMMKLRYEDGMTIKSIASRVGKPIQGMYKFMARLQNSLLQCIEKTMVQIG
ncbi:MAG: sigma-70 family RNA polymerase sigma factor [Planctomycetota bacterium]